MWKSSFRSKLSKANVSRIKLSNRGKRFKKSVCSHISKLIILWKSPSFIVKYSHLIAVRFFSYLRHYHHQFFKLNHFWWNKKQKTLIQKLYIKSETFFLFKPLSFKHLSIHKKGFRTLYYHYLYVKLLSDFKFSKKSYIFGKYPSRKEIIFM